MTDRQNNALAACEITAETIEHVLKLASFDLPKEEKANMLNELNRMVNWFEELQAVDTQDVQPTFSTAVHTRLLRDDIPLPCPNPEDIFKNAPEAHMNFFTVPKVIE